MAERWSKEAEMMESWLQAGQRGPLGMEIVAWMCPNDPDAASAFKWASKGGNAEIVPPCPSCGAPRVAVYRTPIAT